MRRREFIAGLTLPLLARAAWAQRQQSKVFRLAIVVPATKTAVLVEGGSSPVFASFFSELRALGYVEGENLAVQRLSAEGTTERFAEIARDAVASKPDVIVSVALPLTKGLKEITSEIPIVALVSDPVVEGLAEKLGRPGRNITGISSDTGLVIYGKYLDILKAIVPRITKVGLLLQSYLWERPIGEAWREATARAGLTIVGPHLGKVIDESEYRRVVAAMAANGCEGVAVHTSSENVTYRELIVELLNSHRLPTVHTSFGAARSDGLVEYAVDFRETGRTCARFVDRILKGANPAEMPFVQPTKWQTVVNLKTAKALGLTIPETLLARADEVIE